MLFNFLGTYKEVCHMPLFTITQKGLEKKMICFIKTQSKNMKMAWNIRLFIFRIICNFSKCDDFTVL